MHLPVRFPIPVATRDVIVIQWNRWQVGQCVGDGHLVISERLACADEPRWAYAARPYQFSQPASELSSAMIRSRLVAARLA
jgi:hypothetical protein